MKKIYLFVVAALCSVSMAFAEDDTRIVVSECVFTGTFPTLEAGDVWNWSKRHEVGSALTPAVTGIYHIYESSSSSFRIQKKNADDSFSDLSYGSSPTLLAGTYRYCTQLRIDGTAGSTHRLPDPSKSEGKATLTVAGETWTVGNATVGSTYSYAWVTGPEFVIAKKTLPFSFDFKNELNYGVVLKDQAIVEKDLKNYTIGGSEEYTYTKLTNNVPWLNVSSTGIISGTPTVVSEESYTETIKVSDGNEDVTFNLTAGKVAPAQENRQVVSYAVFAGWENPAIGDVHTSSYRYSFQAKINSAAGVKYHLAEATNARFYKKNGDEWTTVADAEAFAAGTYKWSNQLRIDGDNGWFYILDEVANLTVTIDGQACAISSGGSGNGFSYVYISKEFTLGGSTAIDNAAVEAKAIKRMENGQLLIMRDGRTYNVVGVQVQ